MHASVLVLARSTPLEQLPQLVGELAQAQAMALARLAQLAHEKEAEPTPGKIPTEWGTTVDAARCAGLDVSTEEARRRNIKRISGWARHQKWATKPNHNTLLIDMVAFKRWLDLRRGVAL